MDQNAPITNNPEDATLPDPHKEAVSRIPDLVNTIEYAHSRGAFSALSLAEAHQVYTNAMAARQLVVIANDGGLQQQTP